MEEEHRAETLPGVVDWTEGFNAADAAVGDETPEDVKQFGKIWNSFGLSLSNRRPHANINNICLIFERAPEFKGNIWLDEFHHKIFVRQPVGGVRQLTDADERRLTVKLQSDYGMHKTSVELVASAIRAFAEQDVRHELKDYLNSLKWDGEPRIETFFSDYLGAKESETNNPTYTAWASKNFWISMVARAYKPGEKVDTMVVLEGPQGAYKSTALSIIGGKWFSECHEKVEGNKDFYLALQGYLIVEMSEMESFNKAETSAVKRAISRQVDPVRVPYGRNVENFPRACVLVGTTNHSEILRDPTGSRRFWPIKVGKIDIESIKRDRDQLFAETVHRFRAGETWWEMPPNETAEAHENYRVVDEWENLVRAWLDEPAQKLKEMFTMWEVASGALEMEKDLFDQGKQNRLGACLNKLGLERKIKKIDGKSQRRWCRKPTPTLE